MVCLLTGTFALPSSLKDGLLASGFLNNFYSELTPDLVNILASPDFQGMVFAYVDLPNTTKTPAPKMESFIVPGKSYPLSALKPPMMLTTMGNLTIYVDRTLGGIVHLHSIKIQDSPNEFATILMSQQIEGGKSILYVIDKPY